MNYGQGGGGVPPGYTQPGGYNPQQSYGQDPYGQPPNPYGQPANAYAPQQMGMQQPPPKSNVGLIIGIVAGVLGLGLVLFLVLIFAVFRAASPTSSSTPTRTTPVDTTTSSDTSSNELSLPFLQKVAEEASVGLPRMLDSETKEESVSALPGTLVYHNKLVSKSVNQLNVPVFTQILKPSIVSNDCANNAVRNSLLKKGVTLRYSYVDRNNSFIASIDITKHDCGL